MRLDGSFRTAGSQHPPGGDEDSARARDCISQLLTLHLFHLVDELAYRLLTLRLHMGELDSLPLLVSPNHGAGRVDGNTRNRQVK